MRQVLCAAYRLNAIAGVMKSGKGLCPTWNGRFCSQTDVAHSGARIRTRITQQEQGQVKI